MIGELEYLLITPAARLRDNTYGAAISEEIATVTGRSCSIGALGQALYLLVTAQRPKWLLGRQSHGK
jgi:hypothetical protein